MLDIIVKHDTEKYFWTPIPITDDYVNPDVVDLVVTSSYLLDEVIELVKCMGVVFNPKFYLSLDDFHLENAADVFEGIGRPVRARSRTDPRPTTQLAYRQLLLARRAGGPRALAVMRLVSRSRPTFATTRDTASITSRMNTRRIGDECGIREVERVAFGVCVLLHEPVHLAGCDGDRRHPVDAEDRMVTLHPLRPLGRAARGPPSPSRTAASIVGRAAVERDVVLGVALA